MCRLLIRFGTWLFCLLSSSDEHQPTATEPEIHFCQSITFPYCIRLSHTNTLNCVQIFILYIFCLSFPMPYCRSFSVVFVVLFDIVVRWVVRLILLLCWFSMEFKLWMEFQFITLSFLSCIQSFWNKWLYLLLCTHRAFCSAECHFFYPGPMQVLHCSNLALCRIRSHFGTSR